MRLPIGKWGNSLAMRLPAELVRRFGLRDGDSVEAQITVDGALTIRPASWSRRAFASELAQARDAMPMGQPVVDEVRRGRWDFSSPRTEKAQTAPRFVLPETGDGLLDPEEVFAVLHETRSSGYKRIKTDPLFPRPVEQGVRRTRYLMSDLRAYLAELKRRSQEGEDIT